MPYTADNIEINIANGTAILATDYGTSGLGFTSSHAQIAKLVWGNENVSYRASETYPLPVSVYGNTGDSLSISGIISGTGDFIVRTNPTVPLIIKGSTFTTDAAVTVVGRVQGITSGTAIGVTGTVGIANNIGIFGISGATAIGITGGRRLNSSTDSVTVSGNVGISGISMSAASHSIAVWGSDLGNKVLTRIYGSDGSTLGMSGDAIKVALVNPGISFSISYLSTVGVTNDSSGALRVQGYTGSGIPLTVKGQLAGGAVEVGAISPLPVGVSGAVDINDTDIINSLESSAKPLISNLANIVSNTNTITTISNQLSSTTGANVTIREIKRPTNLFNGQKTVTTTPTSIGSGVLKVGVTIKALRSNTGPVYIGNGATLTSTNGYVLDSGDSVFIETDDLKRVFVRIDPGTTATLSYISS
jgi:hypothetical protein